MSPWGQIADLACAKILEYKNKKYKTTKMENKKRTPMPFLSLSVQLITQTYLQCISEEDDEVLQIQHQVRVVTVRLWRQSSVFVVTAVLKSVFYFSSVFLCPYRVRPQGSDDFGQRQLPELLHIRSVDQTLCSVKDVVLHYEEAGSREGGTDREWEGRRHRRRKVHDTQKWFNFKDRRKSETVKHASLSFTRLDAGSFLAPSKK